MTAALGLRKSTTTSDHDGEDDEGDSGDENVGDDTYEDYVYDEEEESKDGILEKSMSDFKKELESDVKPRTAIKIERKADEVNSSKVQLKKEKECENINLIDLKPCKKETSSFNNLFNMPSVSSLLPLTQSSPNIPSGKSALAHISSYSASQFTQGLPQHPTLMSNINPANIPSVNNIPMGFPSSSNFYHPGFPHQPQGMLSIPPTSYNQMWSDHM